MHAVNLLPLLDLTQVISSYYALTEWRQRCRLCNLLLGTLVCRLAAIQCYSNILPPFTTPFFAACFFELLLSS